MKTAILGTRGVPASYGGFETLAEELGSRLVDAGHEVWVYGRPAFVDPGLRSYRGMQLISLPAIRNKHLETLSHTLVSAIHAAGEGFDAVLLCNAANAPMLRILQARGIPVALNVDGLERKRRKWGAAARCYYRLCERLAALMADAVITDAAVIERYYRRAYRRNSFMIPYGSELPRPTGQKILKELGLEAGEYLLFVSRFEPENNPDRVAEAFSRMKSTRKLVMLGDAPYSEELGRRIRSFEGERILLPGAVYGEGYRELLFNCRLYIHATEVGGTHPALVEAMGAARPLLVLDTPENREVAGKSGIFFRFEKGGFEDAIKSLVEDQDRLDEAGGAAGKEARQRFSWDAVTRSYIEVLEALC